MRTNSPTRWQSTDNLSLNRLFVYGTLRRGSRNQFAEMLAQRGRYAGEDRVHGRLYDFGRYPGARPEDGSITGEVFQLLDPAATLAALDEYEGPEFERAQTRTTSGLHCWIYWYVGHSRGTPIATGDWFNR